MKPIAIPEEDSKKIGTAKDDIISAIKPLRKVKEIIAKDSRRRTSVHTCNGDGDKEVSKISQIGMVRKEGTRKTETELVREISTTECQEIRTLSNSTETKRRHSACSDDGEVLTSNQKEKNVSEQQDEKKQRSLLKDAPTSPGRSDLSEKGGKTTDSVSTSASKLRETKTSDASCDGKENDTENSLGQHLNLSTKRTLPDGDQDKCITQSMDLSSTALKEEGSVAAVEIEQLKKDASEREKSAKTKMDGDNNRIEGTPSFNKDRANLDEKDSNRTKLISRGMKTEVVSTKNYKVKTSSSKLLEVNEISMMEARLSANSKSDTKISMLKNLPVVASIKENIQSKNFTSNFPSARTLRDENTTDSGKLPSKTNNASCPQINDIDGKDSSNKTTTLNHTVTTSVESKKESQLSGKKKERDISNKEKKIVLIGGKRKNSFTVIGVDKKTSTLVKNTTTKILPAANSISLHRNDDGKEQEQISALFRPKTQKTTADMKQTNKTIAKQKTLKSFQEEVESDDDSIDAFSRSVGQRNQEMRSRTKKKKRKPLKFGLTSMKASQMTDKNNKKVVTKIAASKTEKKIGKYTTIENESFFFSSDFVLDNEESLVTDDDEEEEHLAFFSETHEEQDPTFIEINRSTEQKRLQEELMKLEKEEETARAKLMTLLLAKWDDQNIAFQSQVKKLRCNMMDKQKKQRQLMAEKHRKNVELNNDKLRNGMKWLHSKQKNAMEMIQRRQQSRGSQGSQQQLALELQKEHQNQLEKFQQKGAEMFAESKAGFLSSSAQLDKHHRKRQAELDQVVQKLRVRFLQQQDQQRLHHLKRHEKCMRLKKDKILEKYRVHEVLDETSDTDSQSSNCSFLESLSSNISTPRPIKSNEVFSDGGNNVGAVLRQKRRKTLFMASTPIHLTVEIHNEGVFVATRGNQNCGPVSQGEEKETLVGNGEKIELKEGISSYQSFNLSDFIPWGFKARKFLYSIICGEIPQGYRCTDGDNIGQGALQGGQMKCMLTDLRTSHQTAVRQRAKVNKELENLRYDVQEKKKILDGLVRSLKSAQDAKKRSNISVEKSKQILLAFKTKARQYFNSDGSPNMLTSPSNQQKLMQALAKYTNKVSDAEERDTFARAALLELAEKVSKAKEANNLAQEKLQNFESKLQEPKESENEESSYIETWVKDTLSSLRVIFQIRRSQLNTKPSAKNDPRSPKKLWDVALSSSCSKSLRKSLWDKMQYRRLIIVLRPSRKSITDEVKRMVEATVARKRSSSARSSSAKSENEMEENFVRAEQLLLLSLHPETQNPRLPSIPLKSPTSVQWAEPGWQIILDVPEEDTRDKSNHSILPVLNIGSILSKNTSECCSTQGRQAASLLNPSDLRNLVNPLSKISKASSPVENNLGQSTCLSQEEIDMDPLSIDESSMLVGYNLTLSIVESLKGKVSSKKRSSSSNASENTNRSTAMKKRKTSKVFLEPSISFHTNSRKIKNAAFEKANKATVVAQTDKAVTLRPHPASTRDIPAHAMESQQTGEHSGSSKTRQYMSDKSLGILQKAKEVSMKRPKPNSPKFLSQNTASTSSTHSTGGMYEEKASVTSVTSNQQSEQFQRIKVMQMQQVAQSQQQQNLQHQPPPQQHYQQQQFQPHQQQYATQHQIAQMRYLQQQQQQQQVQARQHQYAQQQHSSMQNQSNQIQPLSPYIPRATKQQFPLQAQPTQPSPQYHRQPIQLSGNNTSGSSISASPVAQPSHLQRSTSANSPRQQTNKNNDDDPLMMFFDGDDNIF